MSERDAMLDYEWGNQSATVMFSGDETAAAEAQNHRQFFDPYGGQHPGFDDAAAAAGGSLVGPSAHFAGADHLQLFGEQAAQENSAHLCSLYDPRAYGGAAAAAFQHASQVPMLSLEPGGPAGFVVVPKSEPLGGGGGVDFSGASLGLNLGGRTYFSSAEDDFVNRLYRRSRAVDAGSFNTPRCQAEGCNADLTHAKHYHRRHKVCEFHSKAATVIAGGLTQRFCQQCSRFHVLSEFDNGKRSCRRRLADHNRRRRKNPQQPNRETAFNNTHLLDNAQNSSSDSLARSPSDSGAHSSPSVTVAVSPPRMSIDCFGQRSYGYLSNAAAAGSSAASTSSLFFSHG